MRSSKLRSFVCLVLFALTAWGPLAAVELFWNPVDGNSGNDAFNWSRDAAGTLRGVNTIGVTDILRFEGTSQSANNLCFLRAALSVADIISTKAYTGTLILNNGQTGFPLTIGGIFIYRSGNIDFGLGGSLLLTRAQGSHDFAGSTFINPTAGLMRFQGGGRVIFPITSTLPSLDILAAMTLVRPVAGASATDNLTVRANVAVTLDVRLDLVVAGAAKLDNGSTFNGAGTFTWLQTVTAFPGPATTFACNVRLTAPTSTSGNYALPAGHTFGRDLTVEAPQGGFEIVRLQGATAVQGAVNMLCQGKGTGTALQWEAAGSRLDVAGAMTGIGQSNLVVLASSTTAPVELTVGGNLAFSGISSINLGTSGNNNQTNQGAGLGASLTVAGNTVTPPAASSGSGLALLTLTAPAGTTALTTGVTPLWTLQQRGGADIELFGQDTFDRLIIDTASSFALRGLLDPAGTGNRLLALASAQPISRQKSAGGVHTISAQVTLTVPGAAAPPTAIVTNDSASGQLAITGLVNSGANNPGLTLVTSGFGTTVLGAGSAFTGNTQVGGGTLFVNGASASPAVQLTGSNVTLAGSGPLKNVASVGGNGLLSPAGDAAFGVLTGVNVNLTGVATIQKNGVRLQVRGFAAAGVDYDRLIATGLLTINTAGLSELVVDLAGITANGTAQGAIRYGKVTGAFKAADVRLINAPPGVTVTPVDDAANAEIDLIVAGFNAPPTISDIPSQVVNEDSIVGPLGFLVTDADVNDVLTVVATSSNQNVIPNGNLAIAIDSASRQFNRRITATPLPNTNGDEIVITVTVTDGKGGSASDQFFVTVTPVNDAPTVTSIKDQTIAEDTSTGALAFTVDDADNAAATLQVTTSSLNTTLVPDTGIVVGGSGANRTITITPAPNEFGNVTIAVVVTDDSGTEASTTFLVTVLPVNDRPTIAAIGAQTTNEDVAKTVAFVVADVDGDTLTTTAVVSQESVVGLIASAVVNNVNSTVLITPAANKNGTATITLTVNDGKGGTANTAFVLTVTAVNDLPTIAAIGAQTTNEDTAKTVAFVVADVDGDTLTTTAVVSQESVVGLIASAVVNNANSTVLITPAANKNGTATITLTVNDGKGGTANTAFVLTVTAVNDLPTIAAIGAQTTNEDTAKTVAFVVADVDGDTLTTTAVVSQESVVGLIASAVVNNVASTVLITPAANKNGTATITLTVNDGKGGTANTAFVLTVTAINDLPTIAAIGAQTTNEDTAKTVAFVVADVDGDTLTITAVVSQESVVGLIASAVVNNVNSTVLITPAANKNGTATITLTVNDGKGGTANTAFVLTVTAVNDAPTIAAIGAQTTAEDTAKTVAFVVADVDGDTLTTTAVVSQESVTGLIASAVVNNANSTVLITPAANKNGTATITLTVIDGQGGTANTAFVLTVTAVNDAPTIAAIGAQATNEDTAKTVAFVVADVDGDTLTTTAVVSQESVVGLIASAVVNNAASTVLITPAANRNGTATITLTVNDGNGGTANTAFVLTVTAVNDLPTIAAIGAQSTNEDTAKTVAFVVADVDGDTLTTTAVVSQESVVGLIASAVVNNVASTVLITPAANKNGTATITLTVNDGKGGTANTAFVLTITAVNDAPIASDGSLDVVENVAKAGTLVAADVDGEALTFAIINAGAKGTATIVNATAGTFTYTPNRNANGLDTVTFKANDGTVDSNIATVFVDIGAVNDAPTIAAIGAQTTNEDTAKTVAFVVADVDGDTLTTTAVVSQESVVGLIASAVVNNVNSTVLITPAANKNGTATITLTVNDGKGGTANTAFVLTVTAVNDLPTIAAIGAQTTNEDTAKTVAFVVADVDGDTLTTTAVVSQESVVGLIASAVVNNVNSTVLITPAANKNGTATITLTVNDGKGGTANTAFVLTVTAVNDAPVAADGALAVTEDVAKTGTLVASDVDGDALTFAIVAQGNLGVATIVNVATGAFTYAPNLNANGTDSFTFKANDGKLDSNTATITVTITAVNDAPTIAAIGAQTTNEDTAATVAFVVADVDGDTLTTSAVISNESVTGLITSAVVSNANSTVLITPAANKNGTATITLTVNDGKGGTANTAFVLTVTAVNDLPTIATIGAQTTNEDTAKTVAFVVADVDGDTLTTTAVVSQESVVGLIASTVVNNVASTVLITPAANKNGTATITLTVNDGKGGTANTAFVLTVTAVNDAPTIAAIGAQTTNEDTAKTVAFVVADVDGDTLTTTAVVSQESVVGLIASAVVNNVNSTVLITPAVNKNGTATITLTVNDGKGGTANTAFVLTITAVNDLPTIAAIGAQTTNEDTAKTVAFVVADVDGDTLTTTAVVSQESIVGLIASAVVNNVNSTVLITPATNKNGTATITLTVNDGNGGTANTAFVITVTAVNDAPTFAAIGAQTTNEDTAKTVAFVVADVDGDTLVTTAVVSNESVTGLIASAVVNNVAGTVLITPATNKNGTATITLTVNDGNGGTANTAFVLTVTAVNDAPTIAAIGAQTTNEDTAKTVAFVVADVDGDTLTTTAVVSQESVVGLIASAVVNNVASTVLITPAANKNGTATITLTVNDGKGGTANTAFVLTVIAINDAPVALDSTLDVTENAAKAGILLASDVDGDVLTFSIATQGTLGVATITDAKTGAFTYVPNRNANGADAFSFKATDGKLDSNIAKVVVIIGAVNDPPVAVDGSLAVTEDSPQAGTLIASDVDGDALTFTIVNTGAKGTAVITNAATGAFTYTPNLNANGADTVTFKASDGQFDSNIATISVNITAVNDAPTIAAIGAQTTNEDTAKTVAFVVADVDGDSLTTTAAVSQESVVGLIASVVVNNVNSTVLITPAANKNGTATITLTVNDGKGGTANTAFVLTVTAVNDAPTIAAIGAQTTNEDTAKTVSFVVADVDGDILTTTAVVSNESVTGLITSAVVNNVASTVLITPALNKNGTATITLTVNDGKGGTANTAFVLTVTAVNDAPTIAAIGAQTTNEDTAKTVAFVVADVDGDTLTTTAVVSNESVTGLITSAVVNNVASTVLITPALNKNGTATITLTVNDGKGGTANTAFVLTVTAVNDAPTIAAIGAQTTNEDTAKTVAFVVADVDGDTLTTTAVVSQESVVGLITSAVVNNVNSTVLITPAANKNGTATITLTVNDGNGGTANTAFVLTVTAVNDAPTIAAIGAQTTNEDTAATVAFVVADVDGDTLTTTAVVSQESAVGLITSAVVNNVNSTVLITPAANKNGTATITLTVNDGKGGTANTAFVLTVTAVNDAPTIAAIGAQTTNEDTAKSVAFVVADVDGDTLTTTAVVSQESVVGLIASTVVNNVASTVLITPAANKNGTATITLTVNDGKGGTANTAFVLTVTAVNDAPTIAAIGAQNTNEDAAKTVAFVVADVDGDTLTTTAVVSQESAVGLITSAVVNNANSTVLITPAANKNGTATITLTVNDGKGGTANTAFVLTVTAVNDAPTIAAIGAQTTNEDTAKAVTFVVADIDGDAVTTIAAVSNESVAGLIASATVDDAAGTVLITPAANANGSATILLTASDGQGGTAATSFSITVTAVNDAPTITAIVSPPITVNASTGALPFTIADVDSVSLTVTATSANPALIPDGNLVLGGSGGARTITATPLARQTGSAAITVTVSDGALSSATAFTVTVVGAGVDVITAASFTRATDCFVEGTTDVVVVTLGAPSTQAVVLPFTVSGGTATVGADFSVLTASPLVFAPGQTEARIELRFVAEGLAGIDREDDEQFAIVLEAPAGVALGAIPAFTGTIAGQRDALRLRLRGSDLAVSPLTPQAGAAGEAVALTVFDGIAPYTVTAVGASIAAGTLDCGNVDAAQGDGDADPVQLFLVTLGSGTATVTVRDSTGAEIAVSFAPQALASAIVPAPVVLPSIGNITLFTALCPGTAEGLADLKAALVGLDGTQAKAFSWDATIQAYVQLPAEPVGGLTPAHAIFLATRVDLGLDFTGAQSPVPFPVLLRPGFNFIGIPPLDDSGTTRTEHDIAQPGNFNLTDLAGNLITGAERSALIGDKAFLWNGVAYVEISAAGGTSTLFTGNGYWVLNQTAEGESFLLVRKAGSAVGNATGPTKARPVRKLGSPPPPPTESASRAANGGGGGGCGHGSGYAALMLGMLLLALRRWR